MTDTAARRYGRVFDEVAAEYDRDQEFPWPVLEEAARQGLYGWELYAQLSTDPTGLSLPILMEEIWNEVCCRKSG